MNFKLFQTAFLLILALVILPCITYFIDSQFPLSDIQLQTLQTLFKIMFGTAFVCFIVGEITKNTSQVDKLWSLIPIVYVWIVAVQSEWNTRVVVMAILTTLWGIRLTYNFSRRKGYSWKFWEGEEDYRWKVLRENPAFKNPWVWKIFHLLFICCYQMTLILLFTLPIIVAWQGNKPFSWIDGLLTIFFLGLLIFETIADQQQWNFQSKKFKLIAEGKPLEGNYADGFISSGLWSKMRHPNYFAEQSIWVVFYLFSVTASERYLNWSMAGSVLLLLLFQGSADFSENISSNKYPKYKDYIKNTPRFLPKF